MRGIANVMWKSGVYVYVYACVAAGLLEGVLEHGGQ